MLTTDLNQEHIRNQSINVQQLQDMSIIHKKDDNKNQKVEP